MSKKMKRPESWQVRKIAYGLVAVVVGVLGWVGWVDEATGEKIGEQATALIPWVLGVIAPAVAASKTHAGSDSAVTDKDVAGAQYDATFAARSAAEQTANVVAAKVEELKAGAPDVAATLKELAESIPDPVAPAKIADAVLAAIRAEERGEHVTVTVTDAVAAAASAQSARANAASALAPGAGTKSVAAYYQGQE